MHLEAALHRDTHMETDSSGKEASRDQQGVSGDDCQFSRSKAHAKITKTTEAGSVVPKVIVKPENKRKQGKDWSCSQEKASVLLDWIIKPLPDTRGVCVEGQKQGTENFWHSTAIVDVLRPKLVVTTTGSQYKLKGRINKLCTIDNGFSKSVAHAFARGFPNNWKQIIHEFYSQLEDSISICENLSPVVNQKVPKLVSKGNRSASSKPSVSSQKLKSIDATHESHSILTPLGIMKQKISTGDVTVTRSGRMSLPPLARWTGQHYRKVPGSNEVEVIFETDCARKALNQTTTQFLQLPKSCLKMMVFNKKTLSQSSMQPVNTTPNNKLHKTTDCLNNVAATLAADLPHVQAHKTTRRLCAGTDCSPLVTIPDPPVRVPRLHTSELVDKDMRVVLCHVPTCDIRSKTYSSRQSQMVCVRQERLGQIIENVSDSLQQKVQETEEYKDKQNSCTVEISCNGSSNNSSIVQPADSCRTGSRQKRTNLRTNKLLPLHPHNDSSMAVPDSCTQLQVTDPQGEKSAKTNRKGKTPPLQCAHPAAVTGSSAATTTCNSGPPARRSSRQQKHSVEPQEVTQAPVRDDRQEQKARKRKEMNDTRDKEAGAEVSVRSSKRRKMITGNPKKGDGWSEEEKHLLQRALIEVNCARPDYWGQVSEMIGTRSETECQQFHMQFVEKQHNKKPTGQPSTDPKSKKRKGRQKGEPIRGGQGTLKRKQDLRDFLEEQNDGYEDNIFDSSPFVGKKMVPSVFAGNVEQNDSEIFGVNHSCITPGLNSTPGTLPRAKMASVRKTPGHVSTTMCEGTPVSINRRKADQYMKTFIGRQRKAWAGQNVSQVEPGILELSTLPVKSLFNADNVPRIIVDNDEDDVADPSPYMYYWNNDSLDS